MTATTDIDGHLEQLADLVNDAGARWPERAAGHDRETQGDTYLAGVLHGLCIALAMGTGVDSDALFHSQMSGRPPRERKVGEIRFVRIAHTMRGDAHVVERWDGVSWSRIDREVVAP